MPIENATRTTVKRGDNRAVYDAESIRAVLDSSFLCHVGYTIDGEARVLPTAYVRINDAIYLHGHLKNQMMNALLDGQTACVSVTILDGLVLARSGFKHSVNYRSVSLFGKAEVVEGEDKEGVLDRLVNHMVPGRVEEIRPPTPQELNATLVIRIPIDEAAAKIRSGPPLDGEKDYELDIWAGVVNIETRVTDAEPCPRLKEGISTPADVRDLLSHGTLFD